MFANSHVLENSDRPKNLLVGKAVFVGCFLVGLVSLGAYAVGIISTIDSAALPPAGVMTWPQFANGWEFAAAVVLLVIGWVGAFSSRSAPRLIATAAIAGLGASIAFATIHDGNAGRAMAWSSMQTGASAK